MKRWQFEWTLHPLYGHFSIDSVCCFASIIFSPLERSQIFYDIEIFAEERIQNENIRIIRLLLWWKALEIFIFRPIFKSKLFNGSFLQYLPSDTFKTFILLFNKGARQIFYLLTNVKNAMAIASSFMHDWMVNALLSDSKLALLQFSPRHNPQTPWSQRPRGILEAHPRVTFPPALVEKQESSIRKIGHKRAWIVASTRSKLAQVEFWLPSQM